MSRRESVRHAPLASAVGLRGWGTPVASMVTSRGGMSARRRAGSSHERGTGWSGRRDLATAGGGLDREEHARREPLHRRRGPAPAKITSTSLIGNPNPPRWYRPPPGKRALTMRLTSSMAAPREAGDASTKPSVADASAGEEGRDRGGAPSWRCRPSSARRAQGGVRQRCRRGGPAGRDRRTCARVGAALQIEGPIDVRTDQHAAQQAAAAGSRGVTEGGVVYLGADFDPLTAAGRRLLAHELTHVGQMPARSGARRSSSPAPPRPRPATWRGVRRRPRGRATGGPSRRPPGRGSLRARAREQNPRDAAAAK